MRLVERALAAVVLSLLAFLAAAKAGAQDTAVLRTDPDASSVRGLPLCSTYMHLPGPGEAYNCRPQWHGTRRGPTFELGEIELGGGGVEAPVALQHSLFTIGFSGTMWLTRELGVKLHYDYVTGGPRETDVDGDGRSDTRRHSLNASVLTGGLVLRIFDDEVVRSAWLAEVEGGYLFEHDGIFPGGPVVQVALGRQIGKTLGLGFSALQFSLLLVGTQGLADVLDYRSLSLVLRYSIEFATREPRGMERPWHAPDFDYVLGARLDLLGGQLGKGGGVGLDSGLAVIFGLPIDRHIEPRAEVGFTWLGTLTDHDVPLSYTTMGGVRLRGANFLPVFVQVLGGYGWAFGTRAANGAPLTYGDGAILDLSAGVGFADCGLGGSFGVRWLVGLEHPNKELSAIIMFAELDWGSRSGALGDPRRYHDDGQSCSSPQRPSVPYPHRTGN